MGMQENPTEKKGSKISNTEWGLVIGALFVIDLIQIGLDLLAQVGVILNRFIDVFVGCAVGKTRCCNFEPIALLAIFIFVNWRLS